MRKIEIIGHKGQEERMKEFEENQVINFSVAVSESYINRQGEKVSNTSWYECAKWGNNIAVAQYLKKGTQVFVSGKPQSRAWQKDDGTLVSNLGINVLNIQLLGSKNENQSQSQSQPQATSQPQAQATATNFNEEEHDDLPF